MPDRKRLLMNDSTIHANFTASGSTSILMWQLVGRGVRATIARAFHTGGKEADCLQFRSGGHSLQLGGKLIALLQIH
jgi:hypothetical protein